jgi:hypothetical protein
MIKRSSLILLSLIATALALSGCKRAAVKDLPENTALMSQLCQVKQHLNIGFYAGANLVVLDPCNVDPNKALEFEKNPSQSFATYDYLSDVSPNGRWLATVGEHDLQLRDQREDKSRVAVRASKFLTSPRWSPDSNFVFIVTTEDRNKSRPFFNCPDDISEVYVVSAWSGNGTIVGRACAGVPVEAFRWLQR